jgi:hypothetical protein
MGSKRIGESERGRNEEIEEETKEKTGGSYFSVSPILFLWLSDSFSTH